MQRHLLAAAVLLSGCADGADPLLPAMVIDGITATVERRGPVAIVTQDARNPSNFDGQQAMVRRALQAAEVMTGCYVAPGPRRELDAYVAGAEPVRIAVDLQCN
ncbi:MAG: hypothetical protein AAF409_04925 [Pseudomonadota bacterium]